MNLLGECGVKRNWRLCCHKAQISRRYAQRNLQLHHNPARRIRVTCIMRDH